MPGKPTSPTCPNKCKAKSGYPLHLHRVYIFSMRNGRRKLTPVGWYCKKCKHITAD